MKDLVIVFARAPRLGAVKRRLAAEIGQREALRFHAGNLLRVVRELARDRRFATVVAVTPDRARLRVPAPVVAQGHGDLGARMARALGRARRAVIVGCDIPDLGAADVAAAFRALGTADAVFGPAEDGGYWLVGLGPRRPGRPFRAVRWSTRHALADTLASFAHHRVALLRTLPDVDTAADLHRWRRPLSSPCADAPAAGA